MTCHGVVHVIQESELATAASPRPFRLRGAAAHLIRQSSSLALVFMKCTTFARLGTAAACTTVAYS